MTSHTWDGQPAADIDAAWDAMLAAAWWAGRDAAAAKCDAAKDKWLAQSTTYERCHAYAAAAASLAVGISKLTPPPDLAAALAEHTRRAVEAERKAITLIAQKHITVGNDLLDWELGGNERLQWVLNAIAARGTT
jgi:hypothetical protein